MISSYIKTSVEDLRAHLMFCKSYKAQNQLQYKFIPLSGPSTHLITADIFGQKATYFKAIK